MRVDGSTNNRQDKITQLLHQLGDALTDQYGTLKRGADPDIRFEVDTTEVTTNADSANGNRCFIYKVEMQVKEIKTYG